jgi:hypothetical protein
MAVGKEMLLDLLPDDVKRRVVWRENYWLTDEALSTYALSAGLFGHEMHSPIMCIGNGIPAIVCRFEEQTSKGFHVARHWPQRLAFRPGQGIRHPSDRPRLSLNSRNSPTLRKPKSPNPAPSSSNASGRRWHRWRPLPGLSHRPATQSRARGLPSHNLNLVSDPWCSSSQEIQIRWRVCMRLGNVSKMQENLLRRMGDIL